MYEYKITYFSQKLGYKDVIIQSTTEEEANKQFMDLILEGFSVGYCKTECLTLV